MITFMSINPKCDKCKNELLEFGAILLSPPDENSKALKLHLCKDCYEKIYKEIIEDNII